MISVMAETNVGLYRLLKSGVYTNIDITKHTSATFL